MSASKEQLLIAAFKAMPVSEIQRRLDSGGLVPIAEKIARAEIASRAANNSEEPGVLDGQDSDQTTIEPNRDVTPLQLLMGYMVMGVCIYWLMSSEMFFLVLGTIVLPGAAAVIGKCFPILSLVVGWVLSTTFFWLGLILFQTGAFTPKGADFQPLGAVLAFVMYFFVSALATSVGAGMLKGAKHEGSWSDLLDELDAERKETVDRIRH